VTFLEHFGFIEQPFGVTPDPRFLHLGPKHREAMASLVCATEENRGFVALIGPPGMGKTSLLFQYLEGLRHTARTAFLFQSARNTSEFMRYLLTDLGIDTSKKDLPEMNQMLDEVLTEEMRAGRCFVLVIDEAQNLGERLLESVRLLSNFETPWVKLMQIVLAGQPQLAERLARPSMAQLRQRISSFIHLEPFTPEETNAYIDHRLWVAGHAGSSLFTVGARTLIANHSGGIPRNISNLCYQSLVLAHAVGKKHVNSKMVREAISDLAIESFGPGLRDKTPGPQLTSSRSPVASSLEKPGQTVPRELSLPSRDYRRTSVATVSVSVALFLSIVSGVLWKATSHNRPLDETPSVEAAAFPAPATALAPAPETMSPNSSHSTATEAPSGIAAVADPTTGTALNGHVLSLVVEKGTTLRHISLQNLGRFDSQSLAAILSLNPEITDPDRIEAGQRIRLPLNLRRNRAVDAGDTREGSPPHTGKEER
jgi:type II secretory pathway predicted ATPase ExeA